MDSLFESVWIQQHIDFRIDHSHHNHKYIGPKILNFHQYTYSIHYYFFYPYIHKLDSSNFHNLQDNCFHRDNLKRFWFIFSKENGLNLENFTINTLRF